MIMRERNCRSPPFVCQLEDKSVPTIRQRVASSTTIYADESSGWDALHAKYEMGRANHSVAFRSEGVRTNQAVRLLLTAAAGGNRHAPSYQRAIPERLCEQDGVTRRQPARAVRDAVAASRCCRPWASGVAAMEGVLAAIRNKTITQDVDSHNLLTVNDSQEFDPLSLVLLGDLVHHSQRKGNAPFLRSGASHWAGGRVVRRPRLHFWIRRFESGPALTKAASLG